MRENVGRNDQIVRSIVGPALLLVGYNVLGGKEGRAAGLAAMLAGGMITETAMTRTCPVNEWLGINTAERPLISRLERAATHGMEEVRRRVYG